MNVEKKNSKPIIKNSTILSIVTIIISTIALLNSLGLVNNFKLNIHVDSFVIPNLGYKDTTIYSLPLLIPMGFNNMGLKEGVIQDILLEIENMDTKEIVYFEPVGEIDMDKFHSNKQILNVSNMINYGFSTFKIKKQDYLQKALLFLQVHDDKKYKSKKFLKGNYNVKIKIKELDKKYKNKFEFKMYITDSILERYGTSATVQTLLDERDLKN